MKPPSGLARRKGGCALTRGLRSAVSEHLLRRGGPRGIGEAAFPPGETISRPNMAFSCCVAERGGYQPSSGLRGGSIGES